MQDAGASVSSVIRVHTSGTTVFDRCRQRSPCKSAGCRCPCKCICKDGDQSRNQILNIQNDQKCSSCHIDDRHCRYQFVSDLYKCAKTAKNNQNDDHTANYGCDQGRHSECMYRGADRSGVNAASDRHSKAAGDRPDPSKWFPDLCQINIRSAAPLSVCILFSCIHAKQCLRIF